MARGAAITQPFMLSSEEHDTVRQEPQAPAQSVIRESLKKGHGRDLGKSIVTLSLSFLVCKMQ